MKVDRSDLAELRSRVAPLDTPEVRAAYREGRIPRADRVKDIDKRYRWDLLWASGGVPDGFYDRYRDVHIDTALRAIVPPLRETA